MEPLRINEMKRFLVVSSLALAVVLMAEQKASAWSKFNFNIGLNLSREAAENNFFWGLYRNGPHPFAQQQGQGGYGQGGYGQGGYGQGGYGHGGYGHGYPGHGGYGAEFGAPPANYFPMPHGAQAPNQLPAPVQSAPAQAQPANNGGSAQVSYTNWSPAQASYWTPYYWYGGK
jgi:hypothetical protein